MKYELLGKKFEENFQEKPKFFTRAPGRVNLIGKNKSFNEIKSKEDNKLKICERRRTHRLLWLFCIADGNRS